jgi:hypothetical protein
MVVQLELARASCAWFYGRGGRATFKLHHTRQSSSIEISAQRMARNRCMPRAVWQKFAAKHD